MTDVATDRAELVKERPASVGRMFLDRVEATPNREAFRHRVGDEWRSLTWQETKDQVWRISAGLLSLGVEAEQRVAIASSTRVEWVLADLGIMCAGAATTTVYPSTTPDDVAYILGDSGSRVVFAEDDTQVAKVLDHRASLPDLVGVVVFDGTGDDDLVVTLAELEERGRALLAERPTAVDDAVAAVGREDLATLIYTSGTTGRPKGVRLVHDNWTYEGVAIDALEILHPDDVQYLWLPLSHSFGKVLEAAQLRVGFASAIDGNLDRIVDNLGVVQPTFMAGAPRIFEKVRARVITTAQGEGGAKAKIFDWAFRVGHRVAAMRRRGEEPSGILAFQHRLADKLVFHKIRDRLGGRVRFFISGSAALSQDVAEWFDAAGMTIAEGYGVTETSAFTAVNLPDRVRFGTVGPPAPGTEARIADDGELLLHGPGVMRGYHNLPEATAETLIDGWFATGDIGELDEQGYLRITDRKKDLIKTSGGKYVAPQKVEGVLKVASPYISQVLVHGDGRKYVSALVTLDPEAIEGWAKDQGLSYSSFDELAGSREVHDLIESQVTEANQSLERWETIKRFEILPSELSVEEGEVTPSLKVRRRAVEEKYADVLNTMYDSD
jgi:long-chain acyl-CoA synthetase